MHSVVHYYQTNTNFQPILPTEILFLQSNVAASYPHVYGATDVSFKMLVADDQSSFDVVKRSHGGMFVGKFKELAITQESIFDESLC